MNNLYPGGSITALIFIRVRFVTVKNKFRIIKVREANTSGRFYVKRGKFSCILTTGIKTRQRRRAGEDLFKSQGEF